MPKYFKTFELDIDPMFLVIHCAVDTLSSGANTMGSESNTMYGVSYIMCVVADAMHVGHGG